MAQCPAKDSLPHTVTFSGHSLHFPNSDGIYFLGKLEIILEP